jgi:TolA-binding protein
LKLADVFSRIGDQVDARLSLQKLVNRYPGSAEAAEAYRLLQEMGG